MNGTVHVPLAETEVVNYWTDFYKADGSSLGFILNEW